MAPKYAKRTIHIRGFDLTDYEILKKFAVEEMHYKSVEEFLHEKLTNLAINVRIERERRYNRSAKRRSRRTNNDS